MAIKATPARLTPGEIAIALSEAQSSQDESTRVAAIARLLTLYRRPPFEEADEVAADPIGAEKRYPRVPPRVQAFFDWAWVEILNSDNPAAAAKAAKEFFTGKRPAGRTAHSEARNFEIAISVQRYINAGESVEHACRRAKQRSAPEIGSWERIREIYYGSGDYEEKRIWRRLVRAEAIRIAEADS